eukprot:207435_1
MSLILTVILFTLCKADPPPRWGKYGEYPCTNKSVYVGGYVAEGSQNAILLYPTVAIANKTTLPFIAFAHGMTTGGNLLYPAYENVLQEVCSYGYIIGAPQSCGKAYCQKFYQDVITTIKTLSTKKEAIDPSLAFADFDKIAVYGHSMGGAATVHVADSVDLNLTCAAPMHPALAQERNQSTSMEIGIPSLWFTGEQDTTVTPSIVYNGFKQDLMLPKIYADLTDASHTNMIDDEAPYIAQYFDCYIREDKDACAYFFDLTYENNICTGGFDMTQCLLCQNNTAPNCFN